jgi:DNA-binding transcriptional regulator YiaG
MRNFHIPELEVDQCRSCGEIFFSNATDDQISNALRAHVGLLQPEQIRERLSTLGLSQEEFAERTGIELDLISRWVEWLMVPSRAIDNLMRVFLQFENVRAALPAVSSDCCQGKTSPR